MIARALAAEPCPLGRSSRGHAEIVRELVDGAVGLRPHNDNMGPGDEREWVRYRSRVEQAALRAARA